MSNLHPFLCLWDLETDAVLATTDNPLDWGWEIGLDKVGTLLAEVGAGDPGDAASSRAASFAAGLLQAAADFGQSPKPLLLGLSLDGGRTYDSYKMVEAPVRTLVSNRRAIKEEGADLGSILSTVPVERVTFTDIALQDVFNGAANSIVPLAGSGIGSGPIPHLYGLLTAAPGRSGWAGRARLQWTARIEPSIAPTATNVDVDSATTLAACETIVNRLAGAAPGQQYGHYVADPSDAALNLGGQDRSFVVGNVGSTVQITFDATGNADVDETQAARVHLDSVTVKTDDTLLYPACNFVGGKSTAGFPDGSKVTALTVLNGTSDTALADDHWLNGVPLLGINVNDSSGGLFFTILDGTIRPVPGSPATACQSIGVDVGLSGTRNAALLMGSPHGVYIAENADLLAPVPWTLLGDLNANVVRLNIAIDPADTAHRVVFAHVKGSGERLDGVYRWTNTAGWNPILINSNLVDMIATDYLTFWVIKKADQTRVYRYAVGTGAPSPTGGFQLPANTGTAPGVGGYPEAYRLQEVVTVAHDAVPARDSVWVLVSGATQAITGHPEGVPTPAFYLVNVGGGWGSFYNANVDNSLHGPDGTPLQLNRAVGLGVALEGTTATVLVGTDQGIYGTVQALGGGLDWKSFNEQGGLANYNVKSIAAGEAQPILGTTLNRVFCTTEDDLLYSNSAGRWWQTIKGRDRTDAGAHLSSITLSIPNANDPVTGGGHSGSTLPYNRVRSWGTTNADDTDMTTSPIGGADGTHVFIDPSISAVAADVVPKGYYWERYLDQHLDYQYRLVAQEEVCPFTGQQMAQLPELQTNAAVSADKASAGVMLVARRWLQQHARAQTQIVLDSSFSTADAALRSLRPTHRVRLVGQIAIADVSSTGTAVTTRVIDFDGSETLYVLAVGFKKGVGLTVTATVTLGTQLFTTPVSESDLMAALPDTINAVKIWR